MVSFGKGLQLSPFSLDDLESALLHPTELDLTDELHILCSRSLFLRHIFFLTRLHFRLLRVVFNQKRGGTLPKKAINKEYAKITLCPVFPLHSPSLSRSYVYLVI